MVVSIWVYVKIVRVMVSVAPQSKIHWSDFLKLVSFSLFPPPWVLRWWQSCDFLVWNLPTIRDNPRFWSKSPWCVSSFRNEYSGGGFCLPYVVVIGVVQQRLHPCPLSRLTCVCWIPRPLRSIFTICKICSSIMVEELFWFLFMLLPISSFENDIFGFFFSAVRDNGTMMLVYEFPGSNTALIPSCDGIEGMKG